MARSTASAPGAPPPPGGEAPPFGAAGACDVWGTRSCLFPPDAAPGGELVGGADQIARALEQEISRPHAATLGRVARIHRPPCGQLLGPVRSEDPHLQHQSVPATFAECSDRR